VDQQNQNSKEKRTLLWVQGDAFQGWTCSRCGWKSPLPTLLSDPEAKTAYDRLAEGKFRQHQCQDYQKSAPLPESGAFTARLRKLVGQGFKPKDAVEILLLEVELESRGDQEILQRARSEGEDFIRRVRQGLL
jgi:hypothetical protein